MAEKDPPTWFEIRNTSRTGLLIRGFTDGEKVLEPGAKMSAYCLPRNEKATLTFSYAEILPKEEETDG